MTENLLADLSDKDLLELASAAVDEFATIIASNENKDIIVQKQAELFILYRVIQERRLVFEHRGIYKP